MISLKMMAEDYTRKKYSINANIYNGHNGCIIRSEGTTPILPYGEMNIGENIINVREPIKMLRKIKKIKTGDLHISGIPMKIPTRAIVKKNLRRI
ncbi:hypothetical protein ACJMK2_010275 [Sinanodonta woodiana]|uniref:Uncharacterized protein n=1 Tax=Sinanodonta woodiana TaxID=1069815 RepID=A0ABD3VHS5_SINWO